MKLFGRALIGMAVVGFAGSASAVTLLSVNSSFLASDPTTLGRLSRDGVASSWGTVKNFPGVINTSSSYKYRTYEISVGSTPYIQVSLDDPSGVFFASAYQTSYLPATKPTNYLGDAGSTGNPFGNPGFFQIVATPNSKIQILLNDIRINGAVGPTFGLVVEGFTDANYGEPVPEPFTIAALGLGFAAVARKRRR